MKKRMIALGLALAFGIALAQAGDAPKDGDKAPPLVQIQEQLGLTAEQVTKMREIRAAGGSRDEMRAVLTPEQQAKAAELKKAHKGERGNHMKEALGLSDEQVAKMQAIRKEGGSREDVRAVLTPEQQATFDQLRQQHKGKAPQPQPKPQPPAEK